MSTRLASTNSSSVNDSAKRSASWKAAVGDSSVAAEWALTAVTAEFWVRARCAVARAERVWIGLHRRRVAPIALARLAEVVGSRTYQVRRREPLTIRAVD